ncbi:MAG: hypothetical protein B7X06_00450 [Verrucomicrobia bacterium 21-51-4]|nr:MAG: hypothetical protein B7X06_00450 [Verrucomicrobia bacterium 21-51-4]HQU08597.1 carbohydrate porin [Opitutales bacterium]
MNQARPFLRIFRPLTPWLCVGISFLGSAALTWATDPASAPVTNNYNNANDLDAIRQEFSAQFAKMQAMYESRIDQLETRIATLESQEHTELVAQRAEDAAQSAQQSADKAQEAYSSTVASLAESVMYSQGDWDPWANYDDLNKGFEFHGYMRSGAGMDGDGGAQEVFQAPLVGNVWKSRYRLGNENDTYGELIFVNNFIDKAHKEDGVRFKVQSLVAFSADNGRFNNNSSSSSSKDMAFTAREAFAEATGVWKAKPTATFWAGQRYYLKPNIHINKLQIADMSGYGGGIKDVEILDGWAKLGVAWMGGSIDDLNPDGSIDRNIAERNISKNNIIIDVSQFDVLGGKGLAWLTLAGAKGGNVNILSKNVNYPNTSGFALGFVHTIKEFYGGFNQASIQYGKGAASNFDSVIHFPGRENNSAWLFRVSEYFVIQPIQEFSMGATVVYQYSNNDQVNGDFHWISAGLRPVYHFNKYFSIAFEGGIDHTHTKQFYGSQPGPGPLTGANGTLYKATIAPQITPGWDFALRPSLRLFLTYAWWTDGFVNKVGLPNYKGEDNGLAVGTQFEAWW